MRRRISDGNLLLVRYTSIYINSGRVSCLGRQLWFRLGTDLAENVVLTEHRMERDEFAKVNRIVHQSYNPMKSLPYTNTAQ